MAIREAGPVQGQLMHLSMLESACHIGLGVCSS